MARLALLGLLAAVGATRAQYNLAKTYAGSSFFDDWAFFGQADILTNGDVQYVTASDKQGLAYVNTAGNAVIKVDNTTNVLHPNKRNSVRINTTDAFSIGSVFLFDAVHLPYGCTVWPSFWTAGTNWPINGEIDVFEGVNDQYTNQMALHTTNTSSCKKATSAPQLGITTGTDCSLLAGTAGCTVNDTRPASYGPGFAAAGGGLFATQFDSAGIFIWFWPRENIPANLTTSANASTVDPASWGTPAAAYPAGNDCDIGAQFGPQRLVLDITLCGDWINAVYNSSSCSQNTFADPAFQRRGTCYLDNVINNNGSHYSTAYFEIPSIRVFALPNAPIVSSVAPSATGGASGGAPQSTSGGSPAPSTTKTGGARLSRDAPFAAGTAGTALLVLLGGALASL